ncbi:MAG: nucleotidyltransferase domain-containing protein [bacterium]
MDKKNNNRRKSKLNKAQIEIINNYISSINKKIDVAGVLLFGSYAYGKPKKFSDVDLVIISSDFQRRNFFKRMDWLTRERMGIADDVAMDVIGYTPKEFSNIEDKSAIMEKAKKDGIWLYQK